MKNYDAYIFDFDYTLADATDPVVDSFTYALEKMNLKKATRQDIINTIGIPIGESYTILTGDDSEEGINLFKKYQNNCKCYKRSSCCHKYIFKIVSTIIFKRNRKSKWHYF